MSIDLKKISSKFLVSFDGVEIPEYLVELITKHQILGVVIKNSNIEDSMQLFHLIKSLKSLANYPIYIGMDLSKIDENSPIYSDLSYLPPLISLVASNDIENLIKYGENLTSFYNKMGINLDLSLQGTIFNYNSTRSLYSFGEHTENVVKFASRYLEMLQESDVQCGVWGFPGDGESTFIENRLPLNTNDFIGLNNEVLIYRTLIDSNVTMLGVSHHLFNAIDNGRVAFTSNIIMDKLQNELECHSLIMANITPIEIENKFRFDDILDLALKNGLDVCYLENSSSKLINYLQELETRFETSGIDKEKLEKSNEKIELNKKILSLFTVETGDVYLEDDEKDVIVKDTFSEQLCEDSVLILESKFENLPLKLDEYDLVAVVEPEEITSEYISSGAETDSFSFSQYCKDVFNASYQVIADDKTKWEDFKQIIYCVNSKNDHDLKMLERIERYNIPITLISTKGVDIFDYYNSISCSKVVAFGFSEFQRKAIAKVIFDKYKNNAIYPFKA